MKKFDSTQKENYKLFVIVGLFVLVFILVVLSGMELALNAAIIANNTNAVKDNSKFIPVSLVDEDTLLSTDGDIIVSFENQVIRIIPGDTAYYNKDTNQAIIPITILDAFKVSLRYLITDLLFFIALCYAKKYLKSQVDKKYLCLLRWNIFISILSCVLTAIVFLVSSDLYGRVGDYLWFYAFVKILIYIWVGYNINTNVIVIKR